MNPTTIDPQTPYQKSSRRPPGGVRVAGGGLAGGLRSTLGLLDHLGAMQLMAIVKPLFGFKVNGMRAREILELEFLGAGFTCLRDGQGRAAERRQLRLALHAWAKLYNEQWLIERHGFITPIQARRDLEAQQEAAA